MAVAAVMEETLKADLRDCSLRQAAFERTSVDDATLGDIDGAAAYGTIDPAPVFIETADGVQRATPEEVLAYLRAPGADVSFASSVKVGPR